mgnify:CR=1 FL=1
MIIALIICIIPSYIATVKDLIVFTNLVIACIPVLSIESNLEFNEVINDIILPNLLTEEVALLILSAVYSAALPKSVNVSKRSDFNNGSIILLFKNPPNCELSKLPNPAIAVAIAYLIKFNSLFNPVFCVAKLDLSLPSLVVLSEAFKPLSANFFFNSALLVSISRIF